MVATGKLNAVPVYGLDPCIVPYLLLDCTKLHRSIRTAAVCHRDFGPAGILVRADQNPGSGQDKTVRPRDFGPGTEVLV